MKSRNAPPQAAEPLRRALLTCMPEKEEHLYAFVRKRFREVY